MSRFLFTDFTSVDASAISEATNYEATNLTDYNNNSRWASAVATNDQWVQLSFDSDIYASVAVVDNHNIDSLMVSGSVQLLCADDSAFTSNVRQIATFTTDNSDAIRVTFDETTARHWRVYYSGWVNDPPYLGNVFIGEEIDLPFDYSWGYSKDNKEFYTIEYVGLDGAIHSCQPYQGRTIYELNFKLLTDTTKDAFTDFVKTVRGKLFPFYFTDHELLTRYVKFAEDYTPAIVQKWNVNEVQTLKMRSYDVGFTTFEESSIVLYAIYEDEFIDTVS